MWDDFVSVRMPGKIDHAEEAWYRSERCWNCTPDRPASDEVYRPLHPADWLQWVRMGR